MARWPVFTERVTVSWTTPRMYVVVDVEPGENISDALNAAARDEIGLYIPVNVEEFDVEIE